MDSTRSSEPRPAKDFSSQDTSSSSTVAALKETPSRRQKRNAKKASKHNLGDPCESAGASCPGEAALTDAANGCVEVLASSECSTSALPECSTSALVASVVGMPDVVGVDAPFQGGVDSLTPRLDDWPDASVGVPHLGMSGSDEGDGTSGVPLLLNPNSYVRLKEVVALPQFVPMCFPTTGTSMSSQPSVASPIAHLEALRCRFEADNYEKQRLRAEARSLASALECARGQTEVGEHNSELESLVSSLRHSNAELHAEQSQQRDALDMATQRLKKEEVQCKLYHTKHDRLQQSFDLECQTASAYDTALGNAHRKVESEARLVLLLKECHAAELQSVTQELVESEARYRDLKSELVRLSRA